MAGKEAWGYVEVRDGAHMFWWLYYADRRSAGNTEMPLVMWLQVGQNQHYLISIHTSYLKLKGHYLSPLIHNGG